MFLLVGCGDDSTPTEENSEVDLPKVDETTTVVFRNLDLETEENEFHLVGEVNTETQVFYYLIEQDEEEIQAEEEYQVEESGAWEAFEITGEIPMENVEEGETPILMMYGKSKDGDILHPNYIPIDIQE